MQMLDVSFVALDIVLDVAPDVGVALHVALDFAIEIVLDLAPAVGFALDVASIVSLNGALLMNT